MVCRLCLTETNKSVCIFSEEKVQRCIAKFLQLKLSPEDPVSKIICHLCWEHLDSFQDFCLQIEQAQKSLLNGTIETLHKADEDSIEIRKEFILNKDSNIGLDDVKEESDREDETNGDSNHNDDEMEGVDEDEDKDTVKYKDAAKEESHKSGQEHKLEITNEICPETKESSTRRVTRQSASANIFSKKSSSYSKGKRKKLPEIRPGKTEDEGKDEVKNNLKTNSPASTKSEKANLTEEKPNKSEKFLKAMQTSKEFDEIIRKHMNLSCDICSIHLSDFAELKLHFRIVHKRRGYAVCCNKRLNKRGLFVDHINVHNNPEYFKCSECGKILSDRICLHKHIISFHQTDELKTFQCDYCPKKFAKQYLLDQHSVKHVPQNEFTFICSDCGKGFPTNSTLKAHMKQVHSTEYDRMCEICAKLIRGKAAFKRHVEEHEGIVHPQVQCTECGAWLKDKRNLRKHIVTQHSNDDKNYSCNVCGKKAPSKGALQSHMRYVHELSRIFKCTFCDKSFKKTDHLKEHMATHTGEVLYTCPHCPTTFNSRCNMYAHRKKKHREEWEASRALSKKESNQTQIEN